MTLLCNAAQTQSTEGNLRPSLAKYARPDHVKAVWQLINTFVPYAALWALLVWIVRSGISYWFALPVIVVAAGLLVRVFIFFHDCCHGSFFASRTANKLLGYFSGILTFTPFEEWQHTHAAHHAASSDLDRRGLGDVWTLTVEEYLTASAWTRLKYRLMRNPFVLFGLGSGVMFLVLHRIAHKGANKQSRRAVALTNLAILAIILIATVTIGLRTYLLIQIPIMLIAGAVGVWLFYVQHQFEGEYWERHAEWDPVRAAMEGSSFYKLPKVLQWFSGNIGLHHIHHLRPRIPNYRLQQCYDETPALQAVKSLTLVQSFRCVFLNLWDETAREMVSFRSLRYRKRPRA